LADASFDEETTKITNFARNLLRMLTMNSQESVIRLASKAVAYLILVGRFFSNLLFLIFPILKNYFLFF